jgi:hypothetical protein
MVLGAPTALSFAESLGYGRSMARPIHLERLTGRPSKYRVHLGQEICARMAKGEALTRICEDDHMPSHVAVSGWAKRYPEFGRAYALAQQAQARVWAESTLELSDLAVEAKTTQEIYGRQLQVNTRRWLAQRYDSELFGEKVIQPAGGGATVTITLPAKVDPGDSARVIEGQARPIEDGSDDE